ncbi:MAG: GTP-binding protein [Planctomycetaceae bacterium]|jgi:tRNA modification GTPase|nr:GTP-binding protein [Planctomycetaceae bacterium]MBT6157020.1 GTP-binding protein [Planctomycetaceae bacterium]MBT6484414.1 GTP-binding protein [Planctomycetaceae bacterium]MBT6494655.1 GTP-binding protein [Planctomycetaceae bacterium]
MTDLVTRPITIPTAALLTSRGRGAVATVRLVGDFGLVDAPAPPLFRAANGRPVAQQSVDQTVFGQWGANADVSEDVVLCRSDKNIIEVHCHGGEAATAAILSDLESRGCEIVTWQHQAEQLGGRFEAECLEALSHATTTQTADLILEQHAGVLRREIEGIHNLANDGGPDPNQLIVERLDALLRWADFGLHLSKPWQVVLAGRPNVGKSSLINALVGFSRSIVYDQPGTTRDVVTAETAIEGWPVQFSDTAGLRDGGDAVEMAGIERTRETLAEADCCILLFDTSRAPHVDDRQLLTEWPDAIHVAHKCDLPNVWDSAELESALPVSSVTGVGLEELAGRIIARLIPIVPTTGTPVPICQRQVELLTRAREEIVAGRLAGATASLGECLR